MQTTNKVTGLLLVLCAIILVSNTSLVMAHSLGWSVYTQSSTLLPTFKILYSNANSSQILMDDAWSPIEQPFISFWNSPQAFPRMILANNISQLNSFDIKNAQAHNFGKNDYVGYDIEDWALTPQSEQQNYVQSVQTACNDVHNAGYKFAFTPEVDVPHWGQFNQVNWTCIDFLDLQEQFHSTSPSALETNVTQLLASSKAKNPKLVVFVQLDICGDSISASQSQIQYDIQALSQIAGVNGVILQDLCTSTAGNNELTALVNYTDSFSGSQVTPQSTCSGTPVLTFNHPSTNQNQAITATVSGISNCLGYTIQIKNYLGCTSGATIATFTSNQTGGTGPSENPGYNGAGQYGYYACINGMNSTKAIISISSTTQTTVSTTSTTIKPTTTIPIVTTTIPKSLTLSIQSDSLGNQNISISGCQPNANVELYYGGTNPLFNYTCSQQGTVSDYRYLLFWINENGASTPPMSFKASSLGIYSNTYTVSQWFNRSS